MIDYLSADSLESTAKFVYEFTKRIESTNIFPVPRTMPANMVEKVENYLAKKKDKKKANKKLKSSALVNFDQPTLLLLGRF